jgi:HEAT repeat protein
LIRTLEDPYPNVQEAVLEALLLIGGEQVVQSLKGMVHHDSPRMRCHAITLLGKLAPMENQNEIFMALKDENPDVRKTAITALEGMRTEESTLCILGALGDEEPQVRLCALNVLFQNNKENWVKHMAPLAKDENIWVRASIARGLGHFGKKGKPLLLDLLNDKVGVVQIAAMEALGKIQETSVVPLILTKVQTTDPDIKVAAIDSLGCIGDPSVKESLRIFLKDTHWNVRAATANALGKLKDAAVRESLLRLANHDQDSLVRQSARFALDQIQET